MPPEIEQDLRKLSILTQRFFNLFLVQKNCFSILSFHYIAWYHYPDFAELVFGDIRPHVQVYLPVKEINFVPSNLNIPIFPPGEVYNRAYSKCLEYYDGNVEMIVYNEKLVPPLTKRTMISGMFFFDLEYEIFHARQNIEFKLSQGGSVNCLLDANRIILYHNLLYYYILFRKGDEDPILNVIIDNIFRILDGKREIKGIGGNIGKGITRGFARVLDRDNLGKKNEWFNRFDKNDIIIAHNTHVYYMKYIFDAAGIITENANLLSHASLISRELGKGLVLGIDNIFLKIFSGDYIEMNSDTGDITILKRFWE